MPRVSDLLRRAARRNFLLRINPRKLTEVSGAGSSEQRPSGCAASQSIHATAKLAKMPTMMNLTSDAVQRIHAQSKPPAYVIAEIDVADQERVTRRSTSPPAQKRFWTVAPSTLHVVPGPQLSKVSPLSALFFSLSRILIRRKQPLLLQPSWKLPRLAKNTQSSESMQSRGCRRSSHHRLKLRACLVGGLYPIRTTRATHFVNLAPGWPEEQLSRCRVHRTSHVGRRPTFARPS
jgi:hypothetical protein